MKSLILLILFFITVLFLVISIIVFSIIDMISYKKLIDYLKTNNLKNDLVFLKIIDENSNSLPKYRRPGLLLNYLKEETDDNKLKTLKSRYIAQIRTSLMFVGIAIIMNLVFIITLT